MRLYRSFLVRCWLIKDHSGDERSVFDVEHIQSGERTKAATLQEAEQWMLSRLLKDRDIRQDETRETAT